MARLSGVIVTDDPTFRTQLGSVLRTGPVPVTVGDERGIPEGAAPDAVVVDGRGDVAHAMGAIERLRGADPPVDAGRRQ